MTELLKRAEQLDRKNIKPNWTSTPIREVAVGKVTRFHTCKITDNIELFDITLIGPDLEGLEEIRVTVINALLSAQK